MQNHKFILVLRDKAEALIEIKKTSFGIMKSATPAAQKPKEVAKNGRKQLITYKVEMSISHHTGTQIP